MLVLFRVEVGNDIDKCLNMCSSRKESDGKRIIDKSLKVIK